MAVAGVGGAAVTGTVTYVAAANTATFAPTANLLPSTQYTGTISIAAQSQAGHALASNYVWSFTTGTTADVTPPTVTVTAPGLRGHGRTHESKSNCNVQRGHGPGNHHRSGNIYCWRWREVAPPYREPSARRDRQRPLLLPQTWLPTLSSRPRLQLPPTTSAAMHW